MEENSMKYMLQTFNIHYSVQIELDYNYNWLVFNLEEVETETCQRRKSELDLEGPYLERTGVSYYAFYIHTSNYAFGCGFENAGLKWTAGFEIYVETIDTTEEMCFPHNTKMAQFF